MRQRCRDPAREDYRLYGGRGIRVCKRWNDFANFLADMGERPEGHQLSRIDHDGDYKPGNVEWETPSENSLEVNRRRNSYYTKFLAEYRRRTGTEFVRPSREGRR